MNAENKRMLQIIKELREEYGMIAIKAEFEAEGSRLDELIMLNQVVFCGNTKLNIKIGGCEAMRDIEQCKLLDASGIMAPMIETPFAMKKFKDAANKAYADHIENIEWIINAETVTCAQNFSDILNVAKGFLNTVVVGRSDLSASMGVSRDKIDGEAVFQQVLQLCEMAKKEGLVSSIGGGISIDTVPFLMKLGDSIDLFETRKVVLPRPDSEAKATRMISLALEFELSYLRNKHQFYHHMATEDLARMKALEERLKENGLKLR
ncbi:MULTISPECIES: aldolase/citrate lyase family protein [Clostridiaceae]|uniref:Citrate lyase beta subunit n=1 Tax=Clostridium facile TaxID=2763035 RepID=A0ABR7INJ7_9CLOT|nr:MULTISPECIES: aldolase/citrate lyase family protein [Clostridiaceae]MBC5786697.1 citrate lyase beta subunit [Clostridium facile]